MKTKHVYSEEKLVDLTQSEIELRIEYNQKEIKNLVKACHLNINSMNELQKLEYYDNINEFINIENLMDKIREYNERHYNKIKLLQKDIIECVEASINPFGY